MQICARPPSSNLETIFDSKEQDIVEYEPWQLSHGTAEGKEGLRVDPAEQTLSEIRFCEVTALLLRIVRQEPSPLPAGRPGNKEIGMSEAVTYVQPGVKVVQFIKL